RAEQSSYDGDPCRECGTCKDIEAGKALDIIEIDAASNRGIDEIRELREGVRSSPMRLKYKVYIIDEAHQLTKEAFNALLKTLEEPPEHAIFIFATTAADKMPATILSRVQRFDFKKFTVAQIAGKLKKILKAEKMQADDDALGMIAYAAEGGLRDAESMLSQVLSHAAGQVTAETVEEILGIVGFSQVSVFTDILEKKDVKGAIVFLRALEEKGVSAEEFLKSLTQHLRKALLLSVDASLRDAVVPELTDDQFRAIMSHVKRFAASELTRMLSAFIEAQDMMRKTPIAFLPLELALFKLYTEQH
ncbi:DNA polymerase III subunit gamma/tau, partial [Candidatus Azambacteria bacterium]|nr:DNA polymerase III subunit gamma/tau [Candidatus Azambacteria bacterium]